MKVMPLTVKQAAIKSGYTLVNKYENHINKDRILITDLRMYNPGDKYMVVGIVSDCESCCSTIKFNQPK